MSRLPSGRLDDLDVRPVVRMMVIHNGLHGRFRDGVGVNLAIDNRRQLCRRDDIVVNANGRGLLSRIGGFAAGRGRRVGRRLPRRRALATGDDAGGGLC